MSGSLFNKGDHKPLGIGLESAHGTPVAVTRRIHCDTVEPTVEIPTIEVPGTTGDRRLHKNEQRQGQWAIGLSLTLPWQFSLAMEWLLYGLQGAVSGTAGATTTYLYSSGLPSFTIERTRGTEVETYKGCKVNTCEIGGNGNGPVSAKFGIMATDVSVGGSITSLTGGAPVVGVYHDASVAAPTATAVHAETFSITIDNGCEPVYGTNQKPTCIREGMRKVTASYSTRDGSAHASKVDKWIGHSADAAKFHIAHSSSFAQLIALDTRVKANLPGFSGGEPGDGDVEIAAYRDDSTPDISIKMTTVS